MVCPCGMYPLHMWLINWTYFEKKSSPQFVHEILSLFLKTEPRVCTFRSQTLTVTELSTSQLLPPPTVNGISQSKIFNFPWKKLWGEMLPLQIACRQSLSQHVIETLLNASEEGSVCEYDGHGLTALHWALVSPFGPQVDVVETLVSICPDVVLLTEEALGALPLHLACMSRETPLAIIVSLCNRFPQGPVPHHNLLTISLY
jgi:hypothetical protein